MSSINPNNINGNYPIAGQDNDSQGFRDNFTNIKNNLTFAKSEIEDLQNNAIVKNPLSGTTLDNDMAGALLIGPRLQNATESTRDLGTVSGAVNVLFNEGHFQYLTTGGNVTVTTDNWPTSGYYGKLRLEVNVTSVNHNVTFDGTPTYTGFNSIQGFTSNVLADGNRIYYSKPGVYIYELSSYNSGSNITISDTVNSFINSNSQDVANASAISLTTTASYFTTSAAETATLAGGTPGQIKTLIAANVAAGAMVVTVSNAGWKSSGTGTITFDTIGEACTLQYVNSKWYVIGNNGTTFA